MALDPVYFEPFEPLPDRGSVVRACKKDGQPFEGVVRLVFLAMDTPCIKVAPLLLDAREITGPVAEVGIFPEFGDTWELIA